MRRICTFAVILAVLLTLPVLAGEVVTIPLKNGDFVQGEIVDGSVGANGFKIRRFDTGGEVFVSWEHLPPRQVKEFQEGRGEVAGFRTDPIPGIRVVTNNNVYEGILLEDAADKVRILTATGEKQVPVPAIVAREQIRLDPLTIYTPDEYYEIRKAGLNVDSSEEQWAFADFCQRLGLFREAKSHYDEAIAIDSSLQEEYDGFADELARNIKEQEADEIMMLIELAISVGEFDEARTLAQEMEEYEDTEAAHRHGDLAQYIDDQETLFTENRDAYLAKKISEDWYKQIRRMVRELAYDYKTPWTEVRAFVQGQMHTLIRDNIADKYGLDPNEVDRLFGLRPSDDTQSARFGAGTWLVRGGTAGAAAGGGGNQDGGSSFEKAITDAINKGDAASLADVMRRFRNGGGGGAAGGGGRGRGQNQGPRGLRVKTVELQTEQEAWETMAAVSRVSFLEAMYAEKHLTIVDEEGRSCSKCGGKGTLKSNIRGDITCERCHGAKQDVIIKYY